MGCGQLKILSEHRTQCAPKGVLGTVQARKFWQSIAGVVEPAGSAGGIARKLSRIHAQTHTQLAGQRALPVHHTILRDDVDSCPH